MHIDRTRTEPKDRATLPCRVIYGLWIAATTAGLVYLTASGRQDGLGSFYIRPGFVLLVYSVLLIPGVISRGVLSDVSVSVRSVVLALTLSFGFVGVWMLVAGEFDPAWSAWLAVAVSPFWILIATNASYGHQFSGWFTTGDETVIARARELGLKGVGCQFSEPFVGVGFKFARSPDWEVADGMEEMDQTPGWQWTDEIPEAVAMMKLSVEFTDSAIVYIEASEDLGWRKSKSYGGCIFSDGAMLQEWGQDALPRLLRHLDLAPLPGSDFAPALASHEWCGAERHTV